MLCCGYLHKLYPKSTLSTTRGTPGKIYRSAHRFFVLRRSRSCLDYYASNDPGAVLKGSIDLLSCLRIEKGVEVSGSEQFAGCTFTLQIEDQMLYLSASCEDFMLRWVEKISEHLLFLRKANTQGIERQA